MEVIPTIKSNQSKFTDYAILLKNGELVEISCEYYACLTTDEGDQLSYQFYIGKRIVLELEAVVLSAVVSKTDTNYLQIIKAIKKTKPKKKTAVKA
jgi:hypothetical protein